MKKFSCSECGECCKKFGRGYLPLFEDEYLAIKKIGEEKNLNLDLRPVEIFQDTLSKKYFCFMYGLFNEPCVFLKENKCLMYTKRPLICKQFPLFSVAEYSKNKLAEFMECRNFKKIMTEELKEVYPESYKWCEKSNKKSYDMAKEIITLEKEGKINVKSVQNYSGKIMSFSEFILEQTNP